MKKMMMTGCILITAAALAACGGEKKTQPDSAEKSAAAESGIDEKLETEAETEAETETDTVELSASCSTDMKDQDSTMSVDGENGGIMPANPLQEVKSSDEFLAAGLKLRLPDIPDRFQNSVYQMIDGQIAEILFHDTMTGAKASVRAGKDQSGDISGIYYVFDESKTKHVEVKTDSGASVDIMLQAVVEESDFHGVQASWKYEGVSYTLWEETEADRMDMVGELAGEIIKQCKQN